MDYVPPIILILLLLAFNVYSTRLVLHSGSSLPGKIELIMVVWAVPFFGALFPLFSDQTNRGAASSNEGRIGDYAPVSNSYDNDCAPHDADCSDSD
jgi:hypothetical protein